MEGVEVERLVDVLVLSFGLAVWSAVVAWVVQGMDFTIFMTTDKWVLLDWIQVFYSRGWKNRERVGEQEKGKLREQKLKDSQNLNQ